MQFLGKKMNLDKTTKLFRYFIGIPKSLYVNFRLLPFKEAIKLPIIVSTNTKLLSLKGKAKLSKIKTGIVRIGFTGAEMIDYKTNPTMLRIDGEIEFKGKVKIARGNKIIVYGKLSLGNNFITTGNNIIICNKKIKIGSDTMFAWETIIMDNDQHNIYDKKKNIINQDAEINIGDNVWIGAKSMVLKGCNIADGTIIGANSTITNSYEIPNSIIAGNPTKVLKKNVSWQH